MTKSQLWKSDVERLNKLVFAGHHVLVARTQGGETVYRIAAKSSSNSRNPFIFIAGFGYSTIEIRNWKGFEFLDPFPDGEST